MASFNQIVLQIGEDEDGRCGAVRDTCHSPFHSCLIWRKLHLLSYRHLQLDFISYSNALYISSTNASHISFLARPPNINKQFFCLFFPDICREWWSSSAASLLFPLLQKTHFNINNILAIISKAALRLVRRVRQPWELTFGYARMWHFNTKNISLKNRSVYQ